jgi:hypothetical protein
MIIQLKDFVKFAILNIKILKIMFAMNVEKLYTINVVNAKNQKN